MISVFTPIYNRAHIISQLYESLQRQTSFNFEWIIVDDGSTDNIAEIVEVWKREGNPFTILFVKQCNGGKHRAINNGVQIAHGEAFFIVDSDDYITDNAIEIIEVWWKDIARDDRFAGVSGLRAEKNMHLIGDMPMFNKWVDATNLERSKYGLLGDKAEVYKTAILKKYPFPEFEGENFITENVVWDKIANAGYRIRWYNQIIYICEYKEDGLTYAGMKMFYMNPKGWGLYIRQNRYFMRNDKKQDYLDKLDYFAMLHTKLTDNDIMNNLDINEKELSKIKGYINLTLKKIGNNIAIYGLGYRGKRLIRLYQDTPVKIKYVFDKNIKSMDYMQLDTKDIFPKVDAIIVTPKNGQDDIMNLLAQNNKIRLIGYDEWEKLALEI